MSSGEQIWQTSSPVPVAEVAQSKWYAVQTRARHEKVVAERLQEQGLTAFLPLIATVHRWSDRQKKVELPLFSCYESGASALQLLCIRENGSGK